MWGSEAVWASRARVPLGVQVLSELVDGMSVTPSLACGGCVSECTVRRVGDPEAEHVAERADHVEEAHTSPVRSSLRLRTVRSAQVHVRVQRARRARAARGGGQRGEPRGGRGARRTRGRSAHIAGSPPQEVEVESDRLWASPACAATPADVLPGFPVRVQFDDQWCFGVVARVLGASRHVLDITFDNGCKAVVPAFDVFHHDRCEPIVRL